MMKEPSTILVVVVTTMAILGLAAFVAIPLQEASASLVNINGNKVLSNNKGNNNKGCITLCK
jgi:hypothetical protein